MFALVALLQSAVPFPSLAFSHPRVSPSPVSPSPRLPVPASPRLRVSASPRLPSPRRIQSLTINNCTRGELRNFS
jgi:hypothetical protein